MARPDRLVVVTGTGTEIGKTWVAATVARTLRDAGVKVAARKPAQSFEPGSGPTDAEVLAAATGERPHEVCPPHRWYEAAMAPPMAAAALGRPAPTLAALAEETTWPQPCPIGLVEGAGGVASPLADDGDTAALARALRADLVVLVARAGLGTINDVRLAVPALEGIPVVVVLNRYQAGDPIHRRNLDWLVTRDGLSVVTDPAELSLTCSERKNPRP